MGRHDQMVLDIGEDVDGYRVESFVARGGMAVVYKARDRRLGRPVALKLIAPELASDPTFRARFTRESELAASLDHPNVLPIYQAGEIDGMLWTAMRFVDGEDLDTVLARRGRLTPDETITVFSAVAAALDAAHARLLVHRDVKPGNILLTGHDDASGMNLGARHVYLTDFGLTKRSADVTGLTTAGQFLGTIAYVAPEQIASQSVDHRADVYSLGCVLFHVLSGAPPFARDDYVAMLWAHIQAEPPRLSEVVAEVPVAVDAVLRSAMAKQPAARPDSCGALVGQLRDAFGLSAQTPFRLAERPPGRVAGVLDRFASEPGDDAPTVAKAPRPTPAHGTPPRALGAPAPAPVTPAGPVAGNAGAAPEGLGPASGAPSGAPGGAGTAPVAPAAPGAAAPPAAPGGGPASAAPAAPAGRPAATDPLAGVAPGAVPSATPGSRARAGADRDSSPTLLSHRRDPDPPPSAPRSRHLVIVATMVALVVAAVGIGFRLSPSDDTDRTTTASTPTPKPTASAGVPRVVATVNVGRKPQGVAAAPDGSTVYVANSGERSISVIDTEDNRQVATVPTQDQPQYLVVSPDGQRLYVATHNDDGGGNTVTVLNTATKKQIKRIPVDQGNPSDPYAIALSPDGELLYVPDHERSVVTVIGTVDLGILMNLPVARSPHWVTFSRDGKTAYVANHETNQITPVDATTTSAGTPIAVGKSPHSVAVTADGTRAFTANYDVGTASIVDLKNRKTIRDVPVGANPRCVLLSADGKHAYFAATGDDTFTVLDTTTLKQTAAVPVGVDPWVIAVSQDGRTGWVTNRESNTVSVLSLTA